MLPDAEIAYIELDEPSLQRHKPDQGHIRGYDMDYVQKHFIDKFLVGSCIRHAKKRVETHGHCWHTHLAANDAGARSLSKWTRNPCRRFICYESLVRLFEWLETHLQTCNECSRAGPRGEPNSTHAHIRNIHLYLSYHTREANDGCPHGTQPPPPFSAVSSGGYVSRPALPPPFVFDPPGERESEEDDSDSSPDAPSAPVPPETQQSSLPLSEPQTLSPAPPSGIRSLPSPVLPLRTPAPSANVARASPSPLIVFSPVSTVQPSTLTVLTTLQNLTEARGVAARQWSASPVLNAPLTTPLLPQQPRPSNPLTTQPSRPPPRGIFYKSSWTTLRTESDLPGNKRGTTEPFVEGSERPSVARRFDALGTSLRSLTTSM